MPGFTIEIEEVGTRWIGKIIKNHRAKEIGTPQKPCENAEAMLAAVRAAIVDIDPTALPAAEPVTAGRRRQAAA